ncbi:MAG: glycosyltransferase family 4 protein [Pseudomonadota bacterium]
MGQQVVVVTNIPSPYQVELFDAVSASGLDICAVYAFRHEAARRWQARDLGHSHLFLDEQPVAARAAVLSAGLTVFSMYRHPVLRDYMCQRRAAGSPWCFWGERPGARRTGVAGRWYRRWRLGALHRSGVPIWGIGQWAVTGYQREFGMSRQYFNMPYFSNLRRFADVPVHRSTDKARTLLFSGSLIARKGVDLVAAAFARAARRDAHLRLEILGFGKLEASLRRQLAGLGDRVRFHGFRDWDELPEVYARADALIAPSRYDGWGLIIPEGLAAGLPVIGSDAMGAAWDLLESGVNGWRVRAGEVSGVEAAIGDFAALSQTRLNEMRRAARASVMQHQLSHGVERFCAAVDGTRGAF